MRACGSSVSARAAFPAAAAIVVQFAAATADINDVRTNYGLAALPATANKQTLIDEVLYEKRYSLLFEGPQRFDDLREYGRLNSTYLRCSD